MCKCLIDWLFCCCNCGDKEKTHTKDLNKYAKNLHKKHSKQKRKLRKSRYGTTARYGTEWETLVNKLPMTASQIGDSMISREIQITKQFATEEELCKEVLKDYDFSMDNKLGEGSFGDVYKIRLKTSGEWRAVKIIKVKGQHLNRTRFDAFKNEIFCLRAFPNKNIIHLFDHCIVLPQFISFLIMEFAEGGDLLNRLKDLYKRTEKGFPEKEAKIYFVQMANAIHFIHLNDLFHGDLKLDNVLIFKTKDGKEIIKLSDFGCARVAVKEGVLTKMKMARGTVSHMAPEQIRVYITVNMKRGDVLPRPTKSYNPIKADIWSFGVCLYRMLFFDYPFTYDYKKELETLPKMLEQMKKGPQFPEEETRDLIKDVTDLMLEMLEYQKDKRIDIKLIVSHNWVQDSPLLDKNPVIRIN